MELVAELEAGAAPGDVARRHKVRETTLRWWRTELRRSAPGPRLLPVIAGPAERTARHVEIAVGGAVLRFEEGTDIGYVAALARAVSTGC